MYGAGNIGRGFIGKVFADSGYKVCFIDVNSEMIDEFNSRGCYSVKVVNDTVERIEKVHNVYALHGNDERAVEAISTCEVMATAVGVNILPFIVKNIANGIKKRIAIGGGSLNIILAENQLDVDKIMRAAIYKELGTTEQGWADQHLGLVEASIGRMVPPLSEAERENDMLTIAVEPYCELPVDRNGFKGEIPVLEGLKPFSPFDFYIKRKLFLHNMGHAICAYEGYHKGYEYISEAIRDKEIYSLVESAMSCVVQALHREFPDIPINEIDTNKKDLLNRFHNKSLKDTVFRVGYDPVRKLRENDRLVGAAIYCNEQGVDFSPIASGIVAALTYDNPNDENAQKIQQSLNTYGIDETVKRYMSVSVNDKLFIEVTQLFESLHSDNKVADEL